MDPELAFAVALAICFALTNGVQDAANAIATLVATRAATPPQAVALAAVFSLLGPLLVGGAVATTIATVVDASRVEVVPVAGAALAAAIAWNVLTWRLGLPSSSGHALLGGLVGAALAAAGTGAVEWGGLDAWRPVGVAAVAGYLALAPAAGALAGLVVLRCARRALRRASRRVEGPVRWGQRAMTAWLAFSHGSNDAQKAVGVIAVVLLAGGETQTLRAPLWAVAAAAGALTLGMALGGWRIVRTVGKRIYAVRPLDSLASQTGSAAVIFASSLVGAPVSTTHVVASSVAGAGGGRRRWRHVRWRVVREMGVAWVTTIPATAGIAAVALLAWRWVT